MTTLYLAWQDPKSRGWYPVGRLTRHDLEPTEYAFEYIRGAELAKECARPFEIPMLGFPELGRTYHASEIFPMFRYRAMNENRPDRAAYLKSLGLDPDHSDVLDELAISGGGSVADSFEVFPAIELDASGRFKTRFVLHGLRFTNPDSIHRAGSLNPEEPLELAFELNNPVTVHGITVKTADQYIIGWLPRYLVDVMHQDNAWKVVDVEAIVAQVNFKAPLSHHVLVDFSGRLPPGVDPMSKLEMYQPISTSHKA